MFNTPGQSEYVRNKFRLKVIPGICSINPAFEKNALRCIELLNEENAYIENLAEKLLVKNLRPDGRLSLAGLTEEDDVIYRRVVIRFLESQAVGEYEHSHIGIMTENRGKKIAVCLPGNIRVESDGDFLYVDNKTESLSRPPLQEYPFNTEIKNIVFTFPQKNLMKTEYFMLMPEKSAEILFFVQNFRVIA